MADLGFRVIIVVAGHDVDMHANAMRDALEAVRAGSAIDGFAMYAVSVSPSWMTALCVPDQTAEGFTVRFGTPAPARAKMHWIIVR